MKSQFLLLLAMCTLVSCKSDGQKQVDTMRTNIVTYLNGLNREIGNDVIIDSINIISIDTLNEKKDSLLSYNSKIKINDSLQKEVDRLQELMAGNKLYLNEDLVIDLPSNNDLTPADIDKSFDYSMQMIELSGVIGKLDSTIKANKLDTIVTTGYLTKVKVFAHDSKKMNRDLNNQELLLDKNLLVKSGQVLNNAK